MDLEVYFDIKFFDVFDDFLKFGLKHHQMIARNLKKKKKKTLTFFRFLMIGCGLNSSSENDLDLASNWIPGIEM